MGCRRVWLLISITLTGCAATSTPVSTYAGTYLYNVEFAYLTPQGKSEWWCVEGDMSSAELPERWGASDVVVKGVVGPPGHYGNRGACDRIIKVAKLVEVKTRR